MDKPRNVTIDGRRTSVRLAPEYWSALDEIGQREHFALADLCTFIRRRDPRGSFTAAVRVFVTLYFQQAASAASSGRRPPQAPAASRFEAA